MSKKNPKTLNENLERLIEQEIDQALLEEGLTDWVKEKFAAAGNAVKQGWQKVAQQAKKVINGFQAQVAQAMKQAAAQQKKLAKEAGMVQKALVQNGSNINELPGYANVYEFAQSAPAFSQEMAQQAQNVQQFVAQNTRDTSGQTQYGRQQSGAQQTQATQQEAADFVKLLAVGTVVMKEVNEEAKLQSLLSEADELTGDRQLNEAGLLGIALATPAFLNLLLKALGWIIGKGKSKTAQNVAASLKKAAHAIHHLEEKVVDVIPNKAAWAWFVTKQGIKSSVGVAGRSEKITAQDAAAPGSGTVSAQVLNYEQFVANDKVRVKTKMQMYKIALIYLLVGGLQHVLHGIHSAFGGAEAAATAVKGIEVGAEVTEVIASLGEFGSLAGAAVETVDLAGISD